MAPRLNTPAASVDEDVEKGIKGAVAAGIFSGCVTLLFTVLAVAGVNPVGLDASAFLDVVLIFGLTFGISRKSRACAVILLGYFILSKIYMFSQTRSAAGLPMAFVFAYFYAKGVAATFAWHRAGTARAMT